MTGPPPPVQFVGNPIPIPFFAAAYLHADPAAEFSRPFMPPDPTMRAIAVTVLNPIDPPIVVRGIPTLPAYGVTLPEPTVTATQGPTHIHAVQDPNPVWQPASGTYTQLPGPSGVGDYRWSVWSLPDPSTYAGYGGDYPDGSYPLGDPDPSDGSGGGPDVSDPLPSGALQWATDPGPGSPGPSWKTSVPFKPLVIDRNVTGADDTLVGHPRGVSFAQPGSHMYLDMGAPVPQPFTWVMVAIPFGDTDNLHTMLDAGRNPYAVGFPAGKTEADMGDIWTVNDNLAYRTTFDTAGPGVMLMNTAASQAQGYGVSVQVASPPPNAMFPRMSSLLYVRGPDVNYQVHGTVYNGAGFDHRYYVLGRRYGYISSDLGSPMYVMEIRFWKRALAVADLNDQFNQLSATYKFGQYASSVRVVAS
jgi:hypothetical protein